MRLLHVETLHLHEFHSDVPPYAIASHRWQEEEVTYGEMKYRTDMSSPRPLGKKGFQKIWLFQQAIRRLKSMCPALQVDYLWIDTCCIDKTNSVELQEALNSMFRWYAEAEICLAFLHDVDSLDNHPVGLRESFSQSEWFRRGWTLQELVAPKSVLFYNEDWEIIGSKQPLAVPLWMNSRAFGTVPLNDLLAEITGIPRKLLWEYDKYIEQYSIEQRRSWMNDRSTTRKEDAVYCQLGIFGVFIPLIYGEGDHAMVRLEEAIEAKRRWAPRGEPVGLIALASDVVSTDTMSNLFTGENRCRYRLSVSGTPLPIPDEVVASARFNGSTSSGTRIQFTIFTEAGKRRITQAQVVTDHTSTVRRLREVAILTLKLDKMCFWSLQVAIRDSTAFEWLYPYERVSDLDPKMPIRIVCEGRVMRQ